MNMYKYYLIAGWLVFTAVAKAQQKGGVANKQQTFTAIQFPTGTNAEYVLSWTPLRANLQPSPVAKDRPLISKEQPAPSKPAPSGYLNASSLTPDSYYQQCFGYFCKREWELQQKVHVPIKLRLGTYQTAQLQEGK